MESIELPNPALRNAMASLRRFNRLPPAVEKCDLCSAPVPGEHSHLLEPVARRVLCACEPCAILFSCSRDGRYRRVPRRIERWNDFKMSEAQWAGLGVPISLAFFFYSSPLSQMVAMYPSPAGPTEATVPAEAWEGLRADNPVLRNLEPDVQTLLVNRVHGSREYYGAPVDECFKLVGVIRSHWRGLSGGSEVWKQIPEFFDELRHRATVVTAHA